MSIMLQTVYPCQNCNEEIAPTVKFCPECGERQTPIEEKMHYNIFYHWPADSESFNMRYGGHILTLEDAKQLGQDSISNAHLGPYIGAYIPKDVKEINGYTAEINVLIWIKISKEESVDEGPRTVSVSYLE